MPFDEKIKNRLGFGCMRLKMNGDAVDYEEFNKMIDAFIGAGFNYFDTAHGYIEGKSETAIRDCLAARYNREDFVLADKITEWFVKDESEIIPFFESQLKLCGVDYFDFYLVHTVTRNNYEKYKAINAFGTLEKLKKEGRIRHIAMSFHDNAEFLDKVLSEQKAVEAVQLQINYLDFDDPGIQSKKCYDVAVKHGKKVIVMEPVKGGTLANLPERAAKVLDELGGGKSYASYAIRYAASYPEVIMVLSGMGSVEMMNDNLSTMSDFVPLDKKEIEATDRVREIIREVNQIPCTSCNYCAEVCGTSIKISQIFDAYNAFVSARTTRGEAKSKMPTEGGLAADCIGCGRCESVCPQGIEIRDKLAIIAKRIK